jgi:TatD DNase family protein
MLNKSLLLTNSLILIHHGTKAFNTNTHSLVLRVNSIRTTPTRMTSSSSEQQVSYIDIGANLLDEMYQGNYRSKPRHEPDLPSVFQRAWDNHLERIIITAGTLQEAKDALTLITNNNVNNNTGPAGSQSRLYCTAGVHPTRCQQEFGETPESWDAYMLQLKQVIHEGMQQNKLVAMGELGLDYARLEFCNVETQKKGLIRQLELAREVNLPLFLHNRDSGDDLYDILQEHYFIDGDEDQKANPLAGGVVHSFDDRLELAEKFMGLGLFIGINGCSLKTQENLNVVKEIPLDRLLLETDCPWCDIRATHAGAGYVETKFETRTEKKYQEGCCVKGRYEPCHIVQVCQVVAGVKGVPVEVVANASRENAYKLFSRMQ